jgi:hypothetical protein
MLQGVPRERARALGGERQERICRVGQQEAGMAYTIIYEKAGREIGREVIYVNLAAAEAFANDMVATGEYDGIKVRDEADLTQAPDLIDALARLKAFRATWNAGDVIDEGSGLTANDIDVVTSSVTEFCLCG